MRVDHGWLMIPTRFSMGDLVPARLSLLDPKGRHISGDAPAKEGFFGHSDVCQTVRRVGHRHLHSTHPVAVSCLKCFDHKDVLPPLTAYYAMRVGKLPAMPCFAPGDVELAKAGGEMASNYHPLDKMAALVAPAGQKHDRDGSLENLTHAQRVKSFSNERATRALTKK
nr:class II aldolase/adducin family protein [Sulfitobacter sp. DSM 110093]